jgi:hypothetical protein
MRSSPAWTLFLQRCTIPMATPSSQMPHTTQSPLRTSLRHNCWHTMAIFIWCSSRLHDGLLLSCSRLRLATQVQDPARSDLSRNKKRSAGRSATPHAITSCGSGVGSDGNHGQATAALAHQLEFGLSYKIHRFILEGITVWI